MRVCSPARHLIQIIEIIEIVDIYQVSGIFAHEDQVVNQPGFA